MGHIDGEKPEAPPHSAAVDVDVEAGGSPEPSAPVVAGGGGGGSGGGWRQRCDPVRLLRRSWRRHRVFWALGAWAAATGYFVASLALRRKTHVSDVLPLIAIYVLLSGKLLVAFVGTARVSGPAGRAADWAMAHVRRAPRGARYAGASGALLAAALGVALGVPESATGTRLQRMQSLLGIAVIVTALVATSRRPRRIPWRTVIAGLLLQLGLGCIAMKTRWGSDFFTWASGMAEGLLAFAKYGAEFLFGDNPDTLALFAMSVFPALIFFAALVQIMTYLGGVQWLLRNLGWAFQTLLGTTGAESVVAVAAPLVGQSEGMLLVKDCLEHVTRSEIHAFLTAGFSTVSGSMLQGYIALGVNPKNIITSCVMSVPCALALSKIRWPETDDESALARNSSSSSSNNKTPALRLGAHGGEREANLLHAMCNGASTGMQLSLLIAANLIAIVSLVQLADFCLGWLGQFVGIAALRVEQILGWVLYPYAWLLGAPPRDVLNVSQLLGLKFITNEFVAYQRLGTDASASSVRATLTERGRIIAELSLCGFGNLGSIAMQIGLAGTLAPSRKADFSRIALSACITGSIATTLTAAVIALMA
ncbi:hypothetical protein H4R18_001420 [Coemansia javaensis]|uniref:Sodium/nucleoside cotransporter n=1 Tax=Coemansia javaensis TaxID=2761396 RepID=A0A9W8HKP5_9FUNG|nr:hypothetical protein H4R18_001420 [Coemansia javaensis]